MMWKPCFLIMAVFLVQILLGCDEVATCEDISDLESNKAMIGKQYILLKDCYITKSRYSEIGALFPFGSGVFPQKEIEIGRKIKGSKVVGIVPSGTKFVLLRIIKMNIDSNIHFSVMIPLIQLSSGYRETVSAGALVDRTKSDFAFDKNLVRSYFPTPQPEKEVRHKSKNAVNPPPPKKRFR